MSARIISIAGRALLALLFILARVAKIAAPQGTFDQMAAHHIPGILLPLVVLLELAAGPHCCSAGNCVTPPAR